MDDREFFIEYDGQRMHAKLDFPSGELDRRPVLVLLHGYTGHMEERHIRATARTATDEGWVVLRVELYGHGQSDGKFEDHTVLKWVGQAVAAIDYARKLPFADGVVLAGHSQGGLTAMLAGAFKRGQLKGLILLAPAVVIRDGARDGGLFGGQFDPEDVPEFVELDGGRRLNGNYIRAAQLLPVEDAARAYGGPVLIVHADTDEAVPVQCAYDAGKLYRNAELVVIRDDTHCYDNHLEQATEAVGRFLRGLS